LAQLAKRLTPHGFDLAVDLRKHHSTRHVLPYTGARVLAGYDFRGQFPWLDIALESGSDRALQQKRRHISDELLHLVGAIDAACTPERASIAPPPPMAMADLPERVRHVFSRPVVAVHPGAGNVNKQWPSAHFAALIELLIERDGVAVLLVGSKDEESLLSSIVKMINQADRIASVAGDIPLGDLPRLLATCVLFIGNDSGPKHIAAAMGVPTIGIHSGVTSPVEWAPSGKRSVALSRNMTCAPCYLDRIDDCPRDLACLRLLEPALVHQVAETFLARPLAD
jgi:ADP-heptose:LPS heptosyltransferase